MAFLGLCNIGKFSLLTALLPPGLTVRVGKAPGATASVDMFGLSAPSGKLKFCLTDLPGYGFAKMSREKQKSLSALSAGFLRSEGCLAICLLLVDLRRGALDADRETVEGLYEMGAAVCVVGTKSDKFQSVEARDRATLTCGG